MTPAAWVLGVLCALLAMVVAVLAARLHRAHRQAKALAAALAAVAAGNGNRRLLASLGDVLAPAVFAANEVVARYERRLAELERREAAGQRVMASLSHDVRTPLASLMGYLDALERRFAGELSADAGAYVATAAAKAHDLKRYTDELFEYCRLEAGELPLAFAELDVAGEVLPRVGSLIESPGFYPNLTGTENLRIFARLRGIPGPDAVMRALEVVGLPYRDKKLFSQCSLGMKRRLAIALAIMHDPELLILDEPINGLDPIGIAEVRAFIKRLSAEQGKTIIVSSHILSEIELLADDIGIIDHGHLLEEESLAELVAETVGVREVTLYEATLEDYFKRVTGGEGIA